MHKPSRLETLNKAEALSRQGRFDEAIALCDHLLALRAEDASALSLKAYSLQDSGRTAEALPTLRLARLYLPVHAPLRYRLGKALEDLGDAAAALAEYDEALRLDAAHWPARTARAALRLARGDHDGALADCQELVRRAPESCVALTLRGKCYLAAKRYVEAKEDLEKVLRQAPELKGEVERLLADALRPDPNAPAHDEPHGPF